MSNSVPHSDTGKIQCLMTGIKMGESPRWHDGRLWFCDWIGQTLYALDGDGTSEKIAHIASLPFCIDWLSDGRLLVVNAAENRLMRREADGGFVTHADLAPLSAMPWNEIAVHKSGNIYLNNIDHTFGGEFRPGFVALLKPDGTLSKVAEGLAFPNGMTIAPDGSTLIVAESYAKRLTAYAIGADGSLSAARTFADIDGHPDGISVDREGAIWVGAGKHCFRVADGGEVLDTIDLDRECFSCALGGPDGGTLYMTANVWSDAIFNPASEPTGRIYATEVIVPAPGQGR